MPHLRRQHVRHGRGVRVRSRQPMRQLQARGRCHWAACAPHEPPLLHEADQLWVVQQRQECLLGAAAAAPPLALLPALGAMRVAGLRLGFVACARLARREQRRQLLVQLAAGDELLEERDVATLVDVLLQHACQAALGHDDGAAFDVGDKAIDKVSARTKSV